MCPFFGELLRVLSHSVLEYIKTFMDSYLSEHGWVNSDQGRGALLQLVNRTDGCWQTWGDLQWTPDLCSESYPLDLFFNYFFITVPLRSFIRHFFLHTYPSWKILTSQMTYQVFIYVLYGYLCCTHKRARYVLPVWGWCHPLCECMLSIVSLMTWREGRGRHAD